MYKLFFIVCLLTVFAGAVKAQQTDSLNKKNKTGKDLQSRRDSVAANPIVPKVKPRTWHPDSNHSPHKAVMHSLILPGWGQVYNHKIWKVPLIYTALGLMASVYIYNQRNYSLNLKIAKDYEYGTVPAKTAPEYHDYTLYVQYGYSAAAINSAVAGYKRNEELGIFGFVGFWGIQMIDAYIDAKFQHTYTMDTDLSFKISPQLLNQPVYAGNLNGSYIPGLKLTFTLR